MEIQKYSFSKESCLFQMLDKNIYRMLWKKGCLDKAHLIQTSWKGNLHIDSCPAKGCFGSFERSGRDMCCRWVIRCLIRRLFGANVHIYMLLDNTSVGYPGIEKFFGRWTTGDLIPTSPPRRGYLIWRLILVVACTLSRSKFALSDLIGPYRPFFMIHYFFCKI